MEKQYHNNLTQKQTSQNPNKDTLAAHQGQARMIYQTEDGEGSLKTGKNECSQNSQFQAMKVSEKKTLQPPTEQTSNIQHSSLVKHQGEHDNHEQNHFSDTYGPKDPELSSQSLISNVETRKQSILGLESMIPFSFNTEKSHHKNFKTITKFSVFLSLVADDEVSLENGAVQAYLSKGFQIMIHEGYVVMFKPEFEQLRPRLKPQWMNSFPFHSHQELPDCKPRKCGVCNDYRSKGHCKVCLMNFGLNSYLTQRKVTDDQSALRDYLLRNLALTQMEYSEAFIDLKCKKIFAKGTQTFRVFSFVEDHGSNEQLAFTVVDPSEWFKKPRGDNQRFHVLSSNQYFLLQDEDPVSFSTAQSHRLDCFVSCSIRKESHEQTCDQQDKRGPVVQTCVEKEIFQMTSIVGGVKEDLQVSRGSNLCLFNFINSTKKPKNNEEKILIFNSFVDEMAEVEDNAFWYGLQESLEQYSIPFEDVSIQRAIEETFTEDQLNVFKDMIDEDQGHAMEDLKETYE